MKIVSELDRILLIKRKRWFSVLLVTSLIIAQFIWLIFNFNRIHFNSLFGTFFLIAIVCFYLFIGYRMVWNFLNDVPIDIHKENDTSFLLNGELFKISDCYLFVQEFRDKYFGSSFTIFMISNYAKFKIPIAIKVDENQMINCSKVITDL